MKRPGMIGMKTKTRKRCGMKVKMNGRKTNRRKTRLKGPMGPMGSTPVGPGLGDILMELGTLIVGTPTEAIPMAATMVKVLMARAPIMVGALTLMEEAPINKVAHITSIGTKAVAPAMEARDAGTPIMTYTIMLTNTFARTSVMRKDIIAMAMNILRVEDVRCGRARFIR